MLIGFFSVHHGYAQEASSDTLVREKGLSEVVVTATRSERRLADVPIPVTIVSQKQIQSSGASRLDEILAEQTGLAIINNHGFGVQVQGMDPEYCLILINGEPVIGRTAGTLDLTRLSLTDVERIEIIKGPASSLYGSDALAGVINIITREDKATGLALKTKYGSYSTSDNTLTGSVALGARGSASVSVNRFHTDGYDLMRQTYGKTVDPYTDYTLGSALHYRLSPEIKLDVDGRFFSEVQQNSYLSDYDGDSVIVKGPGKVEDGRISPVVTYDVSARWKLKLRSYWSAYRTQNDLHDAKTDTTVDDAFFRQRLWKEELQTEHILTHGQVLTAGAGFTHENVKATRYSAKEILGDYYLYGQHEWHPVARWNILSGLRYDMPTAYHPQLSPKIAAQYRPASHWLVRASVGMGYKAPDFRQLYLTFSNPIVGYSVLGTKEVKRGLAKLSDQGQIARVYIDDARLQDDLRPERSVAYNLGGNYSSPEGWKLGVNFFRNDIKDLIDTRTIAMKTNGQPLYSYYNIHQVFTEGLEAEGSLPVFSRSLVIRAGYQFLIARDKAVVREIRAGKRFVRDPGTLETRRLTMAEYGGLFNRSTHTFNLKLYYTHRKWSANARLVYRGRFGFADLNGDNILSADNEYAPGYALCHLDLARRLWSDRLRLEAGVKDLSNYTDPGHLPYVPGRTWYVGASVRLFKTNTP